MLDKDTLLLFLAVLILASAASMSIYFHYKEWKEGGRKENLFKLAFRGIYAISLCFVFLVFLIFELLRK